MKLPPILNFMLMTPAKALLTIVCLASFILTLSTPVNSDDNGGAEWDVVRGGFRTVIDMSFIAYDDIWGASSDGLFHFDGEEWRLVDDCCFVTSIEMRSKDDGWAGTAAGMLRFDGVRWSAAPISGLPNPYILDIKLSGEAVGWAMAFDWIDDQAATRLLRLSAGQWSATSFVSVGIYDAIAAVGDSELWLAGPYGLAHFDGIKLTFVDVDRELNLTDVAFFDSSSGWAVGGICDPVGEPRRVVFRFRDGVWKVTEDGGAMLNTIVPISATEAVGGDYWGRLVTIRDEVVDEYDPGFPTQGFDCFGGISTMALDSAGGDLVFGGTTGGPFGAAFIGSKAQGKFEQIHGKTVHELEMISEESGWALVGEDIERYTNGRWSTLPNSSGMPEQRSDIAVGGNGELLVGGAHNQKPVIGRFDGENWVRQVVAESGVIWKVIRDHHGTVFALGAGLDSGNLETYLVRSDGASLPWSRVFTVDGVMVDDMAVSDDGDVWIVGQDGVLLYDRNGKLSRINRHGEQFSSVSVTGAQGWIVGEDGILTLAGQSWAPETRLSRVLDGKLQNLMLDRVAAVSGSDVWAVGGAMRVLHFNGDAWAIDRGDNALDDGFAYNVAQLHAVDMVRRSDAQDNVVWVGGDSETIMRREYRGAKATPEETMAPSILTPTATSAVTLTHAPRTPDRATATVKTPAPTQGLVVARAFLPLCFTWEDDPLERPSNADTVSGNSDSIRGSRGVKDRPTDHTWVRVNEPHHGSGRPLAGPE